MIGFACMKGNNIILTPISPKLFVKELAETIIKYLLENF